MANEQKQMQLINTFIFKHCAAWWDRCEAAICQICDATPTVTITTAEDGQPQGNFAFTSKSGKRCNIKWDALTSFYEIAAVDVDEERMRFDHRLLDDDEYAEQKVARVLMPKIDVMVDLINRVYHNDDYTYRDGQEFYNKHSEHIERLTIQAPNIRKESEQE